MSSEIASSTFAEMGLPGPIEKALNDVGYEKPSAIQARTIPLMLEGVDVLGQAQTGTGKTAAFALPILARLDLKQKSPQVLVLAPTRELAIQVAEAFQKYARHLPGFNVMPIYGGTDIRAQLRQLQRGVHVVVGTPGRVMDHMRRGSLNLAELKTLVLDEADEMLRMGFIDDVEWILDQTPDSRQIALFSATMPDAIRRIAKKHLSDPREVTIEVSTVISEAIRQRVWMMAGMKKLDALTRILEVEDFDAIIIFVRTRIATTELADKLAARGYATAALSGDIPQKQRETTVNNLKRGVLDIVVATDVAARGLDVSRVSHVINYDIPYDVEAYVHRIGRTGRAGKQGDAILFVANRERRLLHAIEKAMGKSIEKMQPPTTEQVSDKRIDKFKQRITQALDATKLDVYRKLVHDYQHEYGVPVVDIAAALAAMAQDTKSPQAALSAPREAPEQFTKKREERPRSKRSESAHDRSADKPKPKSIERVKKKPDEKKPSEPRRQPELTPQGVTGKPDGQTARPADEDMVRYRVEVGNQHGVKPGNIVGAIANEAELDSEYIGRIEIFDDHSSVHLPEGMPKEIFKHLKSVWVSGQRLKISKWESGGAGPAKRKAKASQGKKPKAPEGQE